MNINKLFDKYLDITTKDEKTYHIESKYVYINDASSYTGHANMMKKGDNIYILKEVYSLEKNRLRYSYTKYENVKSYNTIQKNTDGTETPIYVIEGYDRAYTNIGSIGNIKKVNSDKIEKINQKTKKDKPLILKLLKRNKNNEVDLESLMMIA